MYSKTFSQARSMR